MLIKSPAKINLFLYVTGRRDNGYHDLFTLMVCVDLYDYIELTFLKPIPIKFAHSTPNPSNLKQEAATPQITVRCDNPHVPQDYHNLAFKAASLFNDRILTINTINIQSLEIEIKKRIPVGAGLGGGSSNAASVLKAMNQFYGSPFSVAQLMKMGLELGADVPFFILGGAAIAEGVGEKLTPVDFQGENSTFYQSNPKSIQGKTRAYLKKQRMSLLLFYPGVAASTANVYKNLDLALTKPVKSNNKCLSKTSDIKQGLDSIKGLMHNDLELTTCALYPEIGLFRKELFDYLPEVGFLPEKVMMTGSGSTFFSIFSDYEKAQRCFSELSAKWRLTKKEIFFASFVN